MRSTTAILALVASASAVEVLPRATPDAKCATEVLSLVANIPTPAPALSSALVAHPQTDACKIDIPSSVSADYSSYTAELLSWYTSNAAEISSIVSDCSIPLSSFTGNIPSCSSTAAPASAPTGKNGNSTVPTAGSPKSTKSSTAGGARETGMGFAVLAAAGLAAIL